MFEGISKRTDVLVIGAGMAGLCAASHLQTRGYKVRVVDKGKGVGGRMATRRMGAATFDHGAQYIVATEPRLVRIMGEACKAGVVYDWPKGPYSEPREVEGWVGRNGMNAFPKFLSSGLDIQLQRTVVALAEENERWRVEMAEGPPESAGAVILTAPAPQSMAILRAGAVRIEPEMKKCLEDITYDRCLAVMATLDRKPLMARVGFFCPWEAPILWVADNQQKGISTEPAVTILATDHFSRKHWEGDRDAAARELLDWVADALKAKVTECSVHGWMYAGPRVAGPYPHAVISEAPPLVLAGDAFGGPRVQRAADSGWEAAEWLTKSFWFP
jgi:renalase